MTVEKLSPEDVEHLTKSLRRMGLIGGGSTPTFAPLAGGVSSLIAEVQDGDHRFCVKSALDKLKVPGSWSAPRNRNRVEVAWLREARRLSPSSVPEVLAVDDDHCVFAMSYLAPSVYPNWKSELMRGHGDPEFAAQVGGLLAKLHAGTAGQPEIASRFASDENFRALRLEPYLHASALAHPDLSEALHFLADRTARTKLALIHGDVSPKNILCGSDGPIILDAECAYYGDPAFDLAFCLNHLALKAVWWPAMAEIFRNNIFALANTYLSAVSWEQSHELEARVSSMLPALALARVDGKSPVEYLDSARQAWVREKARTLVYRSPATITDFWDAWRGGLR